MFDDMTPEEVAIFLAVYEKAKRKEARKEKIKNFFKTIFGNN